MRVRIVRPLTHSVDGIDLSQFTERSVYDVSAALGAYLLAIDAAELLLDDQPAVERASTVESGGPDHPARPRRRSRLR